MDTDKKEKLTISIDGETLEKAKEEMIDEGDDEI